MRSIKSSLRKPEYLREDPTINVYLIDGSAGIQVGHLPIGKNREADYNIWVCEL